MVDRKGFIDLFNQEVKQACKLHKNTSQRSVFDLLNEEYYSFTGKYRFSDYDSFRHFSNKVQQKY